MIVVRIGVVGVGVIGRTHVDALLNEPRCQVAGVADPTAAAYARQRGLRHFVPQGTVPTPVELGSGDWQT